MITQIKQWIYEDGLTRVLKRPLVKKHFRAFLETEFSTENMDCWDAIQHYKVLWALSSNSINKGRALSIFNRYIGVGSPREVNIPADVRIHINQLNTPAQNVFGAIENALMVNMGDSFSRYRDTPGYAQWEKTLNLPRRAVEPKLKMDEIKIKQVLKLPLVKKDFKAFCKKEFSEENMNCWDAIQKYKELWSLSTHSANTKRAMELYHKYLNGTNSPDEVNVNRAACNAVLTAIHSGTPGGDLFDTIEQNIMNNMSDTFSRYILTSGYKKWRKLFHVGKVGGKYVRHVVTGK